MKFSIIFSIIMLLGSTGLAAQPRIEIIEYQLPKVDVLTFSGVGVSARLCPACKVTDLKVTPRTRLHKRNQTINLKQATELFVSNPFSYITLQIRRTDMSVIALSFGGFDELTQPDNSPADGEE